VDAIVLDVSTVQTGLVGVELAELTVDVVLDWLPTVNVTHSIQSLCTVVKAGVENEISAGIDELACRTRWVYL